MVYKVDSNYFCAFKYEYNDAWKYMRPFIDIMNYLQYNHKNMDEPLHCIFINRNDLKLWYKTQFMFEEVE